MDRSRENFMLYGDNTMASPFYTLNSTSNEQSNVVGTVSTDTDSILLQAHNHQNANEHGPLAILWDIENCPVPSDVRPEDVSGNIRMALRVHPIIKGAVTMFSAYGDFNAFPRRLREGCQRTGVKLVDVPNGRKDAADKAILVDMFLFALDNRPPSSIFLISGDVDFSSALHILGQRGYTIILAIPAGVGVSSALSNAGRFVWDWPSIARGESFVPPRSYIPRMPNLSGYFMNCSLGDKSDCHYEEEAIAYRGLKQQTEFGGSREKNDTLSFVATRSQSLPPAEPEIPASDQNASEELPWAHPGDIQGLQERFVRMLEVSGGSLPLVRIPSEYWKTFGRQLFMAEYGACKLVQLINKMSDALVITGTGNKKTVCLRGPDSEDTATLKKFADAWDMSKEKVKQMQGLEENTDRSAVFIISGSSSDDLS